MNNEYESRGLDAISVNNGDARKQSLCITHILTSRQSSLGQVRPHPSRDQEAVFGGSSRLFVPSLVVLILDHRHLRLASFLPIIV